MEWIKYKCIEGFHRNFAENDSSPKIAGVRAFREMLGDDFSGENLEHIIILDNEIWELMLATPGFGAAKYEKAEYYKKELISAWEKINEVLSSGEETEIARMIGNMIWELEEEDHLLTYLSVVETAMKKNRLWKSQYAGDILCYHIGYFSGEIRGMDDISQSHRITTERVDQIRKELLPQFESDFEFLEDDIFKNKLEDLFDLSENGLSQIEEQTKRVNEAESLNFSRKFYCKALSFAFTNLELVGNLKYTIPQIHVPANRHRWTQLHLQTRIDHQKCHLDELIENLARELDHNNYRYEQDSELAITEYCSEKLTKQQISRYQPIIDSEFGDGIDLQLHTEKVIIERTTGLQRPELVENTLVDLGGFAYADDILERIIEMHPEKEWDMKKLRSSFRGDQFYSVGKSGLFGTTNVKDLQSELGDGTINDIVRIYLERKENPVHIRELVNRVNEIFPRPKSFTSIRTSIDLDSKNLFEKYSGGFYGLSEKEYENKEFPNLYGVHGKLLKEMILRSNGISFEDLYNQFHSDYELLDIQVRHLLELMIDAKQIRKIEDKYQEYIPPSFAEEIQAADGDDHGESGIPDEEDVPDPDDPITAIPGGYEQDSFAQIKIRRGQPKFRRMLLENYNNTCIITGCQIPQLLEAAHILPYRENPDYSLRNGLLLRADIHTLLDLNMLGIDPETKKLKLGQKLLGSEEYRDLQDMDLQVKLENLPLPFDLDEKSLRWRWVAFNEGN